MTRSTSGDGQPPTDAHHLQNETREESVHSRMETQSTSDGQPAPEREPPTEMLHTQNETQEEFVHSQREVQFTSHERPISNGDPPPETRHPQNERPRGPRRSQRKRNPSKKFGELLAAFSDIVRSALTLPRCSVSRFSLGCRRIRRQRISP